ncbi:MAG: histidinol-phosphatase [Treponema sp.]|jgi:histidinol-phosphatase (PHP family)|nr:histidinol-phosphatase [Treponema sp.]
MTSPSNAPLSSLHIHSVYCDGSDDIETLCAAAFQKGIRTIGFSSHAPFLAKRAKPPPPQTQWHMRPRDLGAYLAEIHEARQRWAGKLTVYAGLEVDYIQDIAGPADFTEYRTLAENALHYIIASVHYLVPPHGAPFTVDGADEEFESGVRNGYNGSVEDAVNAYWDAEEALVKEGGFEILGHVDLIKKNNAGEKYFSPQSEWFVTRLTRLADRIAASGITVEANTGGLNRGRVTELYPSPFFLTLLRQRNVPVVITADAHCAAHLDGCYPQAVEALRTAGYEEDGAHGLATGFL